jgi:hypothetical protein
MLVGIQSVTFGVIARRYAKRAGLLPPSRHDWLVDGVKLETMLQAAVLLFVAGCAGMLWAVYAWSSVDFGSLSGNDLLRPMILSTCGIAAAVQLGLSAFLLGLIDLPAADVRNQIDRLQQAFGERR